MSDLPHVGVIRRCPRVLAGGPREAARRRGHFDYWLGPLLAASASCHPFRHLRLDGVKIEARAPLHRREIEEGLELLADHLLDEHEAPELELEPIEVLLRAVFRPVGRPARALERIQAQVGDVRHVRVGLFAQPAGGLVDEAELIVVDAHRADRAFAEVEDFVTRGRPFAGDGGHLVVAIQMVLVGPVADLSCPSAVPR